jgi:hypothetical protein
MQMCFMQAMQRALGESSKTGQCSRHALALDADCQGGFRDGLEGANETQTQTQD